MEDLQLSLFDVSTKLGVSPSAIKKRVANLNLPVQRGARGKLIFDERAYALLSQADELLKAGHGFEECRRRLGLEDVVLEAVVPAPAEEAPEAEPVAAEEPEAPVEEALVVAEAPVEEIVPEAPPAPSEELPAPSMRQLPPPVFIQLGRRKAAAEAAPPATPPAAEADTRDAELMTRLDRTLKLMEEKEKQNQTLQAKLLVAYDEMTKLSATAAAFQERSLNLQHEVNKLQGELRLLAAPEPRKPWWKFWG